MCVLHNLQGPLEMATEIIKDDYIQMKKYSRDLAAMTVITLIRHLMWYNSLPSGTAQISGGILHLKPLYTNNL